MAIPKIIHYCWFGGNPFSKMEKEYINKYDSIDYGYNTQIRYDANAIHRINKDNYVNNFKKEGKNEN